MGPLYVLYKRAITAGVAFTVRCWKLSGTENETNSKCLKEAKFALTHK